MADIKKRGRPRKNVESEIEKTLTPKDKTSIRLVCLKLIIENGSRITIDKATDKAEEYYNFVVMKTSPSVCCNKINVEENTRQVNNTIDTVKETNEAPIQLAKTPFGDSGRAKVLLA